MDRETPNSLCARCHWRADSRRRTDAFVAAGRVGMPADPAPRHECKQHEGYGYLPARTREACSDFRDKDGGG